MKNKTHRNIIEVDCLTKIYAGKTAALKNASFTVKKGEVHGLLGPNGAGKSTCIKMMAGLLPISSGKVLIEGQDIHSLSRQRYKYFGLLLEQLPLYDEMSVWDYLIFMAALYGAQKQEQAMWTENILGKLDLNEHKQRRIGNLSRGLKQRVAIAQAVIHSPPIVILDEPTLGLDPHSIIDIRNLVKELKKDHTVIFSSHILTEVSKVCDRVTILNHGEIVTSGPLDGIRQQFAEQKIMNILVEAKNIDAVDTLNRLEGVLRVLRSPAGDKMWNIKLSLADHVEIRAEIVKELVHQGIAVYEVTTEKADLEKIFLQYTE